MLLKTARAWKNLIVPKGKQFRKLPFGLAANCVMKIDFQHNLMLYLGLYEKELESYFRSLIHEGDNCFDVGGQGGYDALMMAKLSKGKVVSFECDFDAAEDMRETFAKNPFDIQTMEGFVCDYNDKEHISLDQAASQTFIPDFIKMDIEGGEDKALLGATSVLSQRKPSLIIEVHGKDKEELCIEILTSYDYNPKVINQRSWLKDYRPLEHNRWLVCEGRTENK